MVQSILKIQSVASIKLDGGSPGAKGALMKADSACIFCKIVAGKADASLVYEDDLVIAFMDIHPLVLGHLLIVPNAHLPDLSALDENYRHRMFDVARNLAQALRNSGIECEGVNLFLADGRAAGQTINHCHLHVIPRFAGDGFRIQFPPHYGTHAKREELNRLAAMVKAALESF
jgi:histidine triad (HIT) family protein